MQDEQYRVGELRGVGGYIQDAVAGLVLPRAGVEAVEATLSEVGHDACGEVSSGIEGHVLEVVGEPVLLVVLQQGSYVL